MLQKKQSEIVQNNFPIISKLLTAAAAAAAATTETAAYGINLMLQEKPTNPCRYYEHMNARRKRERSDHQDHPNSPRCR